MASTEKKSGTMQIQRRSLEQMLRREPTLEEWRMYAHELENQAERYRQLFEDALTVKLPEPIALPGPTTKHTEGK